MRHEMAQLPHSDERLASPSHGPRSFKLWPLRPTGSL